MGSVAGRLLTRPFDDASAFAPYCGLMRLSGRSRLVALVAALAIALLGSLPAAHRHADDGGATVHRHAVNLAGDQHHHDHEAGGHDGRVGSEHAPAQLLPDEYRTTAAFSMAAPTAAAFAIAERPAAGLTRRSDRANVLPTHDPPLRYFSSPAPPLAS